MKLDLEILEAIFTNKGNDLASIAEQNCVMLVFLRHFGCIFCREALDDFSVIKYMSSGPTRLAIHIIRMRRGV